MLDQNWGGRISSRRITSKNTPIDEPVIDIPMSVAELEAINELLDKVEIKVPRASNKSGFYSDLALATGTIKLKKALEKVKKGDYRL